MSFSFDIFQKEGGFGGFPTAVLDFFVFGRVPRGSAAGGARGSGPFGVPYSLRGLAASHRLPAPSVPLTRASREATIVSGCAGFLFYNKSPQE